MFFWLIYIEHTNTHKRAIFKTLLDYQLLLCIYTIIELYFINIVRGTLFMHAHAYMHMQHDMVSLMLVYDKSAWTYTDWKDRMFLY